MNERDTQRAAPLSGSDMVVSAPDSYAAVRFNAVKHGILSRHTVLPHEDADEYHNLLSALLEEHSPQGPTEMVLVEELAGVVWRKRRVLQAEGANIHRGLNSVLRDPERLVPAAAPFVFHLSGEQVNLRELVSSTPDDVREQQRESQLDLEATRKASAILLTRRGNAYERALGALLPDSRDWWRGCLDDGEYEPNADGLAQFIREHLEPFCRTYAAEAQCHGAIKAQTIGEGFQVHRLEKLTRYETHLDRNFERTLAMLLKLKEIRNGRKGREDNG